MSTDTGLVWLSGCARAASSWLVVRTGSRARDPVAALVPDALTTILDPSTKKHWRRRVEVDTYGDASIVLKKVVRYRERRALGQTVFGVVPGRVVFVVETSGGHETLARCMLVVAKDRRRSSCWTGSGDREDGGVSKGLGVRRYRRCRQRSG